jgi:hypothetical protein
MQQIKTATDSIVGPVSIVLTFLHAIPEILASLVSLVTLIYYGYRFYEWLKKRNES